MLTDVDVTGISLVLVHLYNIAIVLALLWMSYGVGRAFIERFLSSVLEILDRSVERLAFSLVCGAGLLGTWILIGCSVLGVREWSLGVLLLPPVLLGARHAIGLPPLLRKAWSEFAEGVGPVGQVILVLAIAFVLIQSLAPPTDWDALVYHLDVPRSFLEKGRIHVPEDNHHVAFVGLLHMLYLPLIAFGDPSGPAILNAFFAALLAVAVFSFGSRFFTDLTARLSPSLLWGTTSLLLVAATARLDTTLAVFLFLGQYALFLLLYERWSRQALFLSALFFGFAIGVKYQALAYLAAVSPMIVWAISRRAPDRLGALKASLLVGIVVLLCVSPWMVKNAALLDAPFYPFFTERKMQGWLEEISGSQQIPAAVDERAFLAYGQARESFNLRDFLLAPGRLTVEPEGSLYFTNLFLVLVVLAPLFIRDGRLMWLILPSVAYIGLVVLPFPSTNVRYLIPAIPALTIASVEIARRTISRFLSPAFTKVVLGIMTAIVLVPPGVVASILFSQFRAPQYAMGLVSTDGYLSSHTLANIDDYWDIARLLNERAGDERVLMLFEARGFYATAPVIQDNVMTNWPLLEGTGATEDCLADERIGYVLVNTGAVEYFQERGVDFGPLEWDSFAPFARRCLNPVHERSGFILYRVKES